MEWQDSKPSNLTPDSMLWNDGIVVSKMVAARRMCESSTWNVWLVRIEMCYKYEIHNGFWKLCTKRYKISYQ